MKKYNWPLILFLLTLVGVSIFLIVYFTTKKSNGLFDGLLANVCDQLDLTPFVVIVLLPKVVPLSPCGILGLLNATFFLYLTTVSVTCCKYFSGFNSTPITFSWFFNILASSTSGSLTHFWKKTMDLKIGWMITGGGLVGTAIGILTFKYFKDIGKIDLIISLSYMYVLAIIGSLMLRDGIMEIDRLKKR